MPTGTPAATDTPAPTESVSPPPTTSTLLPKPTGSTGGVDTDVTISTLEINFGNVAIGDTGSGSVTITNSGSTPFGPINIFGGAPPSPEFNASQNCQGTTLPAGGTCMVNYTFSPTTSGFHVDFSDFTISQTSSQSDGEEFRVAIFGCGATC